MNIGSPRADTAHLIELGGIIAVLRLQEVAPLPRVIEALARGGVRTMEVTVTMPGAVDAIADAAARWGEELLVGAGSVVDEEVARLVMDAGARFVVGPTFDSEVVRVCHRRDVPAIPGAFTPTEILHAWRAGADLVKVFPSRALGPAFLRDLAGPLPRLRLVPTGGVSCQDVGAYLRAGAVAVGLGGALVDEDAVARADYGAITEQARRAMNAVRVARGEAER